MNEIGVIPLIRYRDVTKAVSWLATCFGFKVCNTIKNSDGSIAYAELLYGHGILMIGPVGFSALDQILKQPNEINGINTQCCYIAVNDINDHYFNASQKGAEIVLELGEHNTGEHTYVARDIEGHLWNFGTYDPWKKLNRSININQLKNFSPHLLKKEYSGSLAIFAMVSLLLCSSITFINSYFSASKSSEISPIKTIHADIQGSLSRIEDASKQEKKEYLSRPESAHSILSGGEQVKVQIPPAEESSSNDIFIEKQTGKVGEPQQKATGRQGEFIYASDENYKNISDINTDKPTSPKNINGEVKDETSQTGNRTSASTPLFPSSNMTGSIGDQPRLDPTSSPEEPLPPVTVLPTSTGEMKPSKIKKSLDIKRGKARSRTPRLAPSSTKKKTFPSTEKTLFYLFN